MTTNEKKYCKAKTRKGKRCKNPPEKYGYCHLHLGRRIKTLVLRVSGSFVLLTILAWAIQYGLTKTVDKVIDSSSINDFDCVTEKEMEGLILRSRNFSQQDKRGEILKSDENIVEDTLVIHFLGGTFLNNAATLDFLKKTPNWCPNRVKSGTGKMYCPFSITLGNDNRLMVSMSIYGQNDQEIGAIKDNKFIVNDNCRFMFNYDDKGFEVVNNTAEIVYFSMDLVKKSRIQIRGVFEREGKSTVIADSITLINWNSNDPLVEKTVQRNKPIFEYFDPDWRGKRIEPSL